MTELGLRRTRHSTRTRPDSTDDVIPAPLKELPKQIVDKAKFATPDHSYVQRTTCISLRKQGTNAEQCQSCIERQVAAGGCRFIGLRAFRCSQGNSVTNIEDKTETQGELEICNGKRKGKDVITKKPKIRRLNGTSSDRESIDYSDYCIVGNRLPVRSHSGKGVEMDDKGDTTQPIKEGTDQSIQTPSHIDATINEEHIEYILNRIAPSLERVLRREQAHEEQSFHPLITHPLARIHDIPLQRALCDACATSIFIISYICVVCGKEYCPDCYTEWDEPQNTPRLERCSRRRQHDKSHLVILARADVGEVDNSLKEIVRWKERVNLHDANEEPVVGIDIPVCQILDGDYFSVHKISASLLSEKDFQGIWSQKGVPLIMTDMLSRFRDEWSPESFIARYGSSQCTIHDCSPPYAFHASTVGSFFKTFNASDSALKSQSLKLKDWPPADDFAIVFPDLFTDFESALPWSGHYMRRSGFMNLASRFPEDWNKPDLGPKMYNATPAPGEGQSCIQSDLQDHENKDDVTDCTTNNVYGTTNLHLDITDAINIMMYATGEPKDRATVDKDGNSISTPCAAIWDIFPPNSATKIRSYLQVQNPKLDDPIHRQTFYLSEHDLEKLSAEPYNVCAYRIYQNPGDAVLIPAGCAHQVRNTRSCIKIAVDFLSPESVEMCEGLLQEGRALSKSGKGGLAIEGTGTRGVGEGKREDVLQLWNCLRFTWDDLQRRWKALKEDEL